MSLRSLVGFLKTGEIRVLQPSMISLCIWFLGHYAYAESADARVCKQINVHMISVRANFVKSISTFAIRVGLRLRA